MKRRPSIEHPEDVVLLAYLDGELSRAAARNVKHHLESCWNCRYTAAELELLAQSAYALLSGGDDGDTVQKDAAKAEFLRRKGTFDEKWTRKSKRTIFMLFERPGSSIGQGGLRTTCSPLSI